jgi:hypothetical protein
LHVHQINHYFYPLISIIILIPVQSHSYPFLIPSSFHSSPHFSGRSRDASEDWRHCLARREEQLKPSHSGTSEQSGQGRAEHVIFWAKKCDFPLNNQGLNEEM